MLRIMVYLFVALLVVNVYFSESDKINLPESAHNTIGEIGIIEQLDDGFIRASHDYSVFSADMVYSGGINGLDKIIYN